MRFGNISKKNESKVILLSATPYNKTYLDLSNQLRLFVDESGDLGIRPEQLIKRLGGEAAFVRKHQSGPRTLAAFEHSEYIDDWRELMRLYLVRRTRQLHHGELRRNRPRYGTEISLLPRWDPFLLSHTGSQNGEVRN